MLSPPTAVQLVVLIQLTEDSTVPPAGLPESSHSDPPSVVTITCEPVATHVVSLEHEIPSRFTTPGGTVPGVQVVPPSDVARMAPVGPPDDEPTAVQWSASTHEMAVKSVTVPGKCSDDHVLPPSVVAMMLGEPVPVLKSLTA